MAVEDRRARLRSPEFHLARQRHAFVPRVGNWFEREDGPPHQVSRILRLRIEVRSCGRRLEPPAQRRLDALRGLLEVRRGVRPSKGIALMDRRLATAVKLSHAIAASSVEVETHHSKRVEQSLNIQSVPSEREFIWGVGGLIIKSVSKAPILGSCPLISLVDRRVAVQLWS